MIKTATIQAYKPVVVGTRVATSLYGPRYGVIYKINGIQDATSIESLAGGGCCMMGGRATFDIVFEGGTTSRALPECILRGPQWNVLDDEGVATTDEIAALLQYAAQEDARKQVEAEQKQKTFTEEVTALRIDPQWGHLKMLTDTHGGKHVAINLRIELKRAFPEVKFSVRSDYNSVHVGWVDGPTTDEVKKLTGKWEAGYFNGMEDIYEYSRRPFTEVFGSVKYVFENRKHSLAAMTAAAEFVAKRYGYEPFTVTAYGDGEAYLDCTSHDHQRDVYAYLEKTYPFNEEAAA